MIELEALLSVVGVGVKKLGYTDLIPRQHQLELTVDVVELGLLGLKVNESTDPHQLTVVFTALILFNTSTTRQQMDAR